MLLGVGYSALGAFGIVAPDGTGGLAAAARSLSSPGVWRGLGWSFWAASASTTLAFIGAVLVATLFQRPRRLDSFARFLALLPLPVPHVVAGLVAVLVLSQSGLLARIAFAAGWIDTPAAMPALLYGSVGPGFILAMAAKEAPFLTLVALTLLSGEQRSLAETARTLGASPSQLFRRVTLPLLWRGMLPATVAVFVFVFGNYEVVAMLGPSNPTPFPVLTMERLTGASLAGRSEAYLLSLLGLAVSAAAVAAHEVLRARTIRMGGT